MGISSRKPRFSRRHGSLQVFQPSHLLLNMHFHKPSFPPSLPIPSKSTIQFPPMMLSSLRNLRPRLTLIRLHRMQHDLINPLRRITRIPLTPIITNRIRKNIPIPIKRRARYRPPHLRIPLQSMLRIFIPEMKRAVRASGAESAVYGVEGDGVDGEDVAYVAGAGGVLAMAFEAEV